MLGSFGVIDIVILALYGCILIGMGLYYKRKCTTADEFMVAGRSIRYMVPEPVRLYIEEHGLYAAGDQA